MGTLSYYIILIFINLFDKDYSFMKKSLESKLWLFVTLHDAFTSIYWLAIVVCLGIGMYPMAAILFFPYLLITIYEAYTGRILFLRDFDKKKYDEYFTVDWDEVKRIVKKQKEENDTSNN